MEEAEAATPSPQKEAGDRVIYKSRYLISGNGQLTISNVSQARIGRVQTGQVMPLLYRAPEVILKMPWGKPIDMWSVGMLVRTFLPWHCVSPFFVSCTNAIINAGLDFARAQISF